MENSRPAPPGAPQESPPVNLERLRFYREEIKHEFNLLSNRVSSYVTSQSFLVTAFALSMGNSNPRWGSLFRLIFPLVLSLLGIVVSIQAWPGIKGACDIISLWHEKQNRLFAEDPRLDDYRVERPLTAPGRRTPVDIIHERSLWFAKWSTWIFLAAWTIFGLLALFLHTIA
jgi:hypothetical protein